ncbi:MAG: alpha/beta fold hydrolase [Rubrivivax sp.]|nr:alpha/beta fold hydrolase [Rubrivivax sp.]
MQISANRIAIEVDIQGPADGRPLLLIMGLGMQLVAWPEELVQLLVARGFRVIRIDNRDAGLSQGFDHLGMPNLAWAAMRHLLHLPVHSPYGVADMAADARGVLDALGIARADVCGASMGGMIAQHLASMAGGRVRSLTLMMTSSGARGLPQATLRVRRALLTRPGRDPARILAHLERLFTLIGSPGYPPDLPTLRQRLQASVARAWRPAGTARQLLAVMADGDRSTLLGTIGVPTRVIHGDSDPLLPLAHGQDLLAKIPGAVADIVPGMGHDLPPQLLAHFAAGIADNAARA